MALIRRLESENNVAMTKPDAVDASALGTKVPDGMAIGINEYFWTPSQMQLYLIPRANAPNGRSAWVCAVERVGGLALQMLIQASQIQAAAFGSPVASESTLVAHLMAA